MKTIDQKLDDVETKLRRWHTRLKRASTEINKLTKRRRSLMVAAAQAIHPVKLIAPPEPVITHKVDYDAIEAKAAEIVDAPIPDFLNRANPVIAEEMTRKRKEAEAEARRQMPLTGRAALEAIKPKRKKK